MQAYKFWAWFLFWASISVYKAHIPRTKALLLKVVISQLLKHINLGK